MTRYDGGTSPPALEQWLDRVLPSAGDELKRALLENIITLPEGTPGLLHEDQERRNATFQNLVRSFIIDIRYGCTNPGCQTPHCFSRQRRIRGKPLRRPTFLTARMNAFLLASEPDAWARLCPNGSRVPIAPLNKYLEAHEDALSQRPSRLGSDDITWLKEQSGLPIRNYLQKTRSPDKKDRKSLAQNLFDMKALKKFEWKRFGPLVAESLYQENGRRNTMEGVVADLKGLRLNGPVIDARNEPNQSLTTPDHQSFRSSSLSPAASEDTSTPYGSVRKTNGHLLQPYPAAVEQRSPEVENQVEFDPARTHIRDDGIESLSKPMNGDLKGPVQHLPQARRAASLPPDHEQEVGVLIKNDVPASAPTTGLFDSHNTSGGSKNAVVANVGPEGPNHLSFPDVRGIQPDHTSCLFPLSVRGSVALGLLHRCVAQTEAIDRVIETSDPGDILCLSFGPQIAAFIDRTMHYTFSSAHRICQSFPELDVLLDSQDPAKATPAELAPLHALISPRCLEALYSPQLLESLSMALESLFIPPPQILAYRSPRMHPVGGVPSDKGKERYLTNREAAKVVAVCIATLISQLSLTSNINRLVFRDIRRDGWTTALEPRETPRRPFFDKFTDLTDDFEYEPAIRLTYRLVRTIAARMAFDEILDKTFAVVDRQTQHGFRAVPCHIVSILDFASLAPDYLSEWGGPVWRPSWVFLERLRTLILKEWDGTATFKRWDAVGGAIAIMREMFLLCVNYILDESDFHMPFLTQRLDVVHTATEYLRRSSDPNTFHILDAPFLFTPGQLVVYFRTLNYESMSNAYQYAGYHNVLLDRLSIAADPIRQAYIASRMKPALRKFLVLEVRREHLLEDTFNQLWGCQKRELMRPLKVRMGMDQGEEGVDHGGVSQEFFRLVFARAFDADAQLFTVDPRTRMAWFDPMSREPLPTYEMLGLLVSLAIYNGITLPVTFPIAFYTKLLGRTIDRNGVMWTDTAMLHEGWADLGVGMRQMLSWAEGDVSEVFVREYAFSVRDNADTVYNINIGAVPKDDNRPIRDIIKDGGEPLQPAPLVTNENRHQFVQDYADWLLHRSIAPQFSAFARGFHTCLDAKALALLSPSLLRDTAEGYNTFSVQDLKAITRYEDGYTPDHPFMATFWNVVTSLSTEQQKALLEFVTASDRVPVTGMESVQFFIVRNGPDSELLPTSMTCFGKLLLPEYGSEEKLRAKLERALEHSKGFGTA